GRRADARICGFCPTTSMRIRAAGCACGWVRKRRARPRQGTPTAVDGLNRLPAHDGSVTLARHTPFVPSAGLILNKDGAAVEGRRRFDLVRDARYARRERSLSPP